MKTFVWTGGIDRLRECAFRELCLKRHLDCPGVIDDQCWFDYELQGNKPLSGVPKELVENKPIPKDEKPIEIQIVEI